MLMSHAVAANVGRPRAELNGPALPFVKTDV